MGYMTLADFRTDVQSTLGSRGLANATLDRYINFGYLDVTGAMNFEILNSENSLSTTINQQYVDAPSNLISIKMIRNVNSGKPLIWIPLEELFRRPSVPTAQMDSWHLFGSRVYLRPTPNAVYSLNAFCKKSPTRLTAVGDVSVLPHEFDTAILMLANYYGFLLTNQESRAAYWLGLAINNLQSKIVPSDVDVHDTGYIETLKQRLSILQAQNK